MRLLDDLERKIPAIQPETDALRREPTAEAYLRYLTRTFGFVAPIERAIATTPGIEAFVDLRRFMKTELLQRDLAAMHVSSARLSSLPQCGVPLFSNVHEALGWAYFIERSTLGHSALFRHFASAIPGEVAFASAYLKCYVGSIGEMWSGFAKSLDLVPQSGDEAVRHVVDAATLAARFCERWYGDHESESPARTAVVSSDAEQERA